MSRLSISVAIVAASALIAGTAGYTDSVREWQKTRDAKLRSPDGWLALVGLHWLKPGSNPITFARDFSGTVDVNGDRVTLHPNGKPAQPLSYDEKQPDVIHAGSISFYVIKRADRFALRVKDSNSPALKSFAGMKYFPVNPELRFEARFVPDAKKIPILNIVGQTDMEDSPGRVQFTYRGRQYELRPIFEDQTLFFLFKDPTNRTQTYQAGRMLNTPLPKDGKVDLDFNRSYNPPCTFTPYATCPLPPRENMLPFPVEAGELRYGRGHVEYAQR